MAADVGDRERLAIGDAVGAELAARGQSLAQEQGFVLPNRLALRRRVELEVVPLGVLEGGDTQLHNLPRCISLPW